MKNFLKSLKPFIKPFLVLFAIYAFAFLAVWRSGISFVDDRGRAIFGYAWTSDFNRWSSSAIGLLLNVNDRLLDISPWPQILAMAILSITGVILTYIFNNKKIKYLPLILTSFIGLLPLTIECWLYKFDAPCIAISVLVSVLPILFWPKSLDKKSIFKFGLITILCQLIMWTTYQAASGIFPVLCVYMALKDYLDHKPLKPIFKTLLISAIAFIIPALIIKFCFPEPIKSYRTNEMLPLANLIPGLIQNFLTHLNMIITSLNFWQKILTILSFIGIFALIVKKYKTKTLAIALAFLVAFPLSMGAYLLLENPPFTPRSLLGIGTAFVPVLILATTELKNSWQYFSVAPSLVLLYSCIMFVLALGNALVDQERWATYRNDDLASALSELYPNNTETAKRSLQISGDIGYSKVMQHTADKYPATNQIITFQQTGLSAGAWGLTKIRSYYGRHQEYDENNAFETFCSSSVAPTIVKDTYYFTIRESDTHVCVDIK